MLVSILVQTSRLFARKATPGSDYVQVPSSSIIMKDGATEGAIPVVIKPDRIPELNEDFMVRITGVGAYVMLKLNGN